MKAVLNVRGVDVQLEGEAGEIVRLINSVSGMPEAVAAPAPVAAAAVTHKVPKITQARRASLAWSEKELMMVVEFVKKNPLNLPGLPERGVRTLRNKLSRTDSGIHNVTWRVQQFLQGNPAGAKHLSRKTIKIFGKNDVRPVTAEIEPVEETLGFLGRVNGQGYGRAAVQEA